MGSLTSTVTAAAQVPSAALFRRLLSKLRDADYSCKVKVAALLHFRETSCSMQSELLDFVVPRRLGLAGINGGACWRVFAKPRASLTWFGCPMTSVEKVSEVASCASSETDRCIC